MAVVTRLTPNTHDKSQCSQPEGEREAEKEKDKEGRRERESSLQSLIERVIATLAHYRAREGVVEGAEKGKNRLILPGKIGIFKNLHSIIAVKYGLIVDPTLYGSNSKLIKLFNYYCALKALELYNSAKNDCSKISFFSMPNMVLKQCY